MFAIDTNILIYAHFERYPQHTKAQEFCAQHLFGTQDWCMGWQVLYEYIRVTTHPRVHEKALSFGEALKDLQPYLNAINCHVLTETPQHLHLLAELQEKFPRLAGNILHDCHYATILREHGVNLLYTADSDFRQFGFLKVIDPTS